MGEGSLSEPSMGNLCATAAVNVMIKINTAARRVGIPSQPHSLIWKKV